MIIAIGEGVYLTYVEVDQLPKKGEKITITRANRQNESAIESGLRVIVGNRRRTLVNGKVAFNWRSDGRGI